MALALMVGAQLRIQRLEHGSNRTPDGLEACYVLCCTELDLVGIVEQTELTVLEQ